MTDMSYVFYGAENADLPVKNLACVLPALWGGILDPISRRFQADSSREIDFKSDRIEIDKIKTLVVDPF